MPPGARTPEIRSRTKGNPVSQIDQDIREFGDDQLVAVIALAELMLRTPAQLDAEKHATLVRRLGMFRAEKAERGDRTSTLADWARIAEASPNPPR